MKDGSFAEILRGDIKPGDRVVVDEVARDGRDSSGAQSGARPHFHF